MHYKTALLIFVIFSLEYIFCDRTSNKKNVTKLNLNVEFEGQRVWWRKSGQDWQEATDFKISASPKEMIDLRTRYGPLLLGYQLHMYSYMLVICLEITWIKYTCNSTAMYVTSYKQKLTPIDHLTHIQYACIIRSMSVRKCRFSHIGYWWRVILVACCVTNMFDVSVPFTHSGKDWIKVINLKRTCTIPHEW